MKVAMLAIDSREHFRDYQKPEPYFATAPEALLQGFAQIPEVEVHVISCLKEKVAPTNRLAPNIFFHALHVPGKWARQAYASCVRATRAKLREIQPDIVHGQGTERDCALAAVRSGFPNVLTIHGNMRLVAKALRAPFFSFHTIQGWLEAYAVKRAGGVICLTNYTLANVKHEARKTWVWPNAVNETYFGLHRDPEPNEDVLCIANIDHRKNQNFLIRALEPVAEANNMRLVFLGLAREEEAYSREFLALARARPWVRYEGFKRGEALNERLRSARILMLPSLEENCPMVALEAMAVGLPLAAARSGGTPDLVDDGVTGLLFDPTDEGSARAAALKLFNDAPFAARLAAAGKIRAREKHHPLPVARRHMEIYQEILGERTTPGVR